VALDKAERKLVDKALPNDETRLGEILASLSVHGTILPGLAMRQMADLHPG
jgi:hypothetical protein